MTDSPLRSLNCPNCAAPLDFPEARTTVNCKFCGSVIERSGDDDAPTPDEESHALKLNVEGTQVKIEKVGDFTQARRFVIKMRNGQPMVIESGHSNISITPENVAEITGRLSQAAKSNPVRRGVFSVGGCVGAFIFLTACVVPAVAILGSVPGIGTLINSITSGRVGDVVPNANTLGTRYLVGDGAAFAPRSDDAPPDVILYAQTYPASGNGEKRVVAVSGESPKFLWQSEKFSDDTYGPALLANRELVFVNDQMRLLALRRADGTTAWSATLADEVDLNLCGNCLQLLGGTLVALSSDGTLEAFDAATGDSQWKFTATQDSPRGLYLLGGQPAFMDESDASRGTLRVFEVASGQQRTVPIVCKRADSSFENEASWTTPLHLSPDGKFFYVAFDNCLQKWEADTLKQEWNANLPESMPSLSEGEPMLATAEAFYAATYQKLLRADAASGAITELWAGEDYAVRPLLTNEFGLLALAQRQRGSTRYELWLMNGNTGELRWKAELGETPPLGAGPFSAMGGIISDDETAWTFHPTAESLLLLRFYAAADDVSHALRYETINWATGVSSGEKEIKLGVDTIILSAPRFMLWRNDVLWMDIESQLLAFDARAGQITYRWP